MSCSSLSSSHSSSDDDADYDADEEESDVEFIHHHHKLGEADCRSCVILIPESDQKAAADHLFHALHHFYSSHHHNHQQQQQLTSPGISIHLPQEQEDEDEEEEEAPPEVIATLHSLPPLHLQHHQQQDSSSERSLLVPAACPSSAHHQADEEFLLSHLDAGIERLRQLADNPAPPPPPTLSLPVADAPPSSDAETIDQESELVVDHTSSALVLALVNHHNHDGREEGVEDSMTAKKTKKKKMTCRKKADKNKDSIVSSQLEQEVNDLKEKLRQLREENDVKLLHQKQQSDQRVKRERILTDMYIQNISSDPKIMSLIQSFDDEISETKKSGVRFCLRCLDQKADPRNSRPTERIFRCSSCSASSPDAANPPPAASTFQ